mmetsp:Transcript_3699/g.8373  ORF Transcript_3699/g.8373 Transcript_3699/m.8373 type:complete len:379 (+) Transcript_3699:86-1222(+)
MPSVDTAAAACVPTVTSPPPSVRADASSAARAAPAARSASLSTPGLARPRSLSSPSSSTSSASRCWHWYSAAASPTSSASGTVWPCSSCASPPAEAAPWAAPCAGGAAAPASSAAVLLLEGLREGQAPPNLDEPASELEAAAGAPSSSATERLRLPWAVTAVGGGAAGESDGIEGLARALARSASVFSILKPRPPCLPACLPEAYGSWLKAKPRLTKGAVSTSGSQPATSSLGRATVLLAVAESRRQKISRRETRLVASRVGLRSLCAWLQQAHGSRLRRSMTQVGAGARESASKYSTSQIPSGAASASISAHRNSRRLQKVRLLRRRPWRMCTARPSARRSLKAPCGIETISSGPSLACMPARSAAQSTPAATSISA